MKLSSLNSKSVRLPALILAAITPALLAATSEEAPPQPPPQPQPAEVVATVGGEEITAGDVMKQDATAFQKDHDDYELALRQVELRHREAQHELLRQQLEGILDRRALELEAKARGTTPDVVLADLKVPAVTEAEDREFYESRKALTAQSFEELKPQIDQHLAGEHSAQATRAFYDDLRAKHQIVARLPPYRVTVAAQGPSRGSSKAPITIVEFGDFQCPFCRATESTLSTVLSKHPDQVRVVFRNMPLQSVHPNATIAARAGVCADRQGKFWEMHDAMFANQEALSQAALERTARHLGMKLAAFDACLGDARTIEVVDRDAAAGTELNINSTPFFFINGRPLKGNVPAERFEEIIADELAHNRNGEMHAAR